MKTFRLSEKMIIGFFLILYIVELVYILTI